MVLLLRSRAGNDGFPGCPSTWMGAAAADPFPAGSLLGSLATPELVPSILTLPVPDKMLWSEYIDFQDGEYAKYYLVLKIEFGVYYHVYALNMFSSEAAHHPPIHLVHLRVSNQWTYKYLLIC